MSVRETIENARHALLRDKNLQGDTLTMHPLTWRRIMHEGPLELFHFPNERPAGTSYMGYKIVEAKIMPVNRISVKRAGREIGVIALDGDDPAGRIADAALRDLQQRARQASWNIENTLMAVHRISREAGRIKVVEKLSRHMRLPVPECDIGLFDPQQCLAAINFFKAGAR